MTSQYIPLDSTAHRLHGWRRQALYPFAQQDATVPVLLAELGHVLAYCPIAFRRRPGGGYQAVALQGLHPGDNLFVDSDGRWQVGYVPSTYRGYPFALLQVEHDGKVVYMIGFDQGSGLYREVPDRQLGEERFFDDEGAPSRMTQHVAAFLTETAKNRGTTQCAVDALAAAKLLEPWDLGSEGPGEAGPTEIELYRVSRVALKGLPGTVLEILRDAQALDLAYAQLLSLPRLSSLRDLVQSREQTRAAQAAFGVEPDGRVVQELFDPQRSDTIRFNW